MIQYKRTNKVTVSLKCTVIKHYLLQKVNGFCKYTKVL